MKLELLPLKCQQSEEIAQIWLLRWNTAVLDIHKEHFGKILYNFSSEINKILFSWIKNYICRDR